MSSQFPDLSLQYQRTVSWFVLFSERPLGLSSKRWQNSQKDSEASLLSSEVPWGQLIQVLRDLAVCLLNASDLPHLGLQVSNLLKNYILPKIRQLLSGKNAQIVYTSGALSHSIDMRPEGYKSMPYILVDQ